MADRILILGAGVYQVPLIVAAKKRGIETIVASYPGPYPGIALADKFVPVDISNQAGMLAVAREFNICAVVTAGADAGLVSLGCIVDELSLRGPGQAAANCSTNKVEMKRAFRDSKVPSAQFEVFTDLDPARQFANVLGYPVMVKAPDSSGSRGVIRVNNEAAFEAAWQEALNHSSRGQIIVERCLIGKEYGAQAIVHGAGIEAIFIHDDTVTGDSLSTPVGHAMPTTLSTSEINQTEQVVTAAIAAVGLCECVANVDLMLTATGPQIIELGGRMGATGIPEMISMFSGWDIYEHVLDLALGEAKSLPKPVEQPNAVLLLRSEHTGNVLSLDVPPEIRNNPSLVDLRWDVVPGDAVRAFRVGPDRIGQLQVIGKSTTEATHLAEVLSSGIIIKVQESS